MAGVPHTPVMPIVEYRGKRDVAVTVQTCQLWTTTRRRKLLLYLGSDSDSAYV